MNLIELRKTRHKLGPSDRKKKDELLEAAVELGKSIGESKNFSGLLFYAKAVLDFSEQNAHTCVFFMEQIHKRMGQLIREYKSE